MSVTPVLAGLPNPAAGVIYILTNEAMPGLVKIGRASDLTERLYSMDNTSVPLPFECFYAHRVQDMVYVERQLHLAFADTRVRKNREFFRILPERIKAALVLAPGQEVTIEERSIVQSADDLISIEKARERRPIFRFSMINVQPGTVLCFANDPLITATVADDRRITFEGEIMSIGAAAGIVLRRTGRSDSVAGTDYWTINGVSLWNLRNEAESISDD